MANKASQRPKRRTKISIQSALHQAAAPNDISPTSDASAKNKPSRANRIPATLASAGRPLAVAVEMFFDPDDRKKCLEYQTAFEQYLVAYSERNCIHLENDEITSLNEEIQERIDIIDQMRIGVPLPNVADRCNKFMTREEIDVFLNDNEHYIDQYADDPIFKKESEYTFIIYDTYIDISELDEEKKNLYKELHSEIFELEAERAAAISAVNDVNKSVVELEKSIKWPHYANAIQKLRLNGLHSRLKAGELIAFGFVAGHRNLSRIDPSEWQGDWVFSESIDRARRETPPIIIDKIRIITQDEELTAKDVNVGGRPSKIEEDFNLWEAQAVIGKRRPLRNIADAFADFNAYLIEIDGDKAEEWNIDTFSKHLKKNRPVIHAALTAPKAK